MRIRSVPLFATALLGALAGTLVAGPAQAAGPVTYVALGDSYSSGVGAGGYDPASGSCERSPRSYTALWVASHTVARFTSVACSGATTTDVLDNQVGALTAAATMVTITIGGNDAGFVNVVTTCLFGTDWACDNAVNNAKAYATNTLPSRLDRTYAAIRGRAPNARVIVLGYPRLFELTPTCGFFGMDLTKRRALDSGADTLAGVIAARAGAAGDTFVDVRSNFAGHGICAGQPWINTTTWPVSDSYHPTGNGYRYGYLPALVGVTG
ncbi:MAG: lipase [Actinobacteria bacterium 13_2_20CM_2_71_6]|nr:MAG: lipase [Actinobacteria bacterium 13_2_20CM_2_71_6]